MTSENAIRQLAMANALARERRTSGPDAETARTASDSTAPTDDRRAGSRRGALGTVEWDEMVAQGLEPRTSGM